MEKEIIIRNFSRYAHLYDRYANVQKKTALRLLKQLQKDSFTSILEIGCGTGNYTRLLREKFKNAKLKAIDICEKMIEMAKVKLYDKEIDFMVADAEGIFLNEDFDLITSNACFQWFADLEKALIKYKYLLKKEGIISFSIFGPHSFWELNSSLSHILKNTNLCVDSFINKERLEKILNRNFQEIKLIESRFEESYPCLKDLLRKIKYTGVRGFGLNEKNLISPQFLNKLEDFYLDRFKQIKATYQVFFCQGKCK